MSNAIEQTDRVLRTPKEEPGTMSEEKRGQAMINNEKQLLNTLTELGGGQFNEDSMIEHSGTKLVIPQHMSLRQAIGALRDHDESQKKTVVIQRTFDYRPWDGAYCTIQALRRVFGTSGRGEAQTVMTPFGPQTTPPQLINIKTGPNTNEDIPWGLFSFPLLEGEITFDSVDHPVKGPLFAVSVECPRSQENRVQGLFKLIQNELETSSLYRGQAFNGAVAPEFLDPSLLDETRLAYSENVWSQLGASVWSVIEHTEETEACGLPLKRSVLLAGDYGTGKSLAAMLTAKKALANGWTFIQCRPATDNLNVVMQTARLYEPCVVFYEDVDNIAKAGMSSDDIAKVLDLFDGIAAKHTKLMMVLTTNHPEDIHQGLVRPGRLDSVIMFEEQDAAAKETMVRRNVHSSVSIEEETDFVQVTDAMKGYSPSFLREAVDRVLRYAIARTGKRPETVTTEDLVQAAEGLRPQYELMKDAKDSVEDIPLTEALTQIIVGSIQGMEIKRDENGRTVLVSTK